MTTQTIDTRTHYVTVFAQSGAIAGFVVADTVFGAANATDELAGYDTALDYERCAVNDTNAVFHVYESPADLPFTDEIGVLSDADLLDLCEWKATLK